jgi:hypothetical protein
MARIVANDVLDLLKRDGSKRAAHIACLRAIPFCTESETLKDGVDRLGAWFDMSVELNHKPLHQVVSIVLACFLIVGSNRVTCGADLNKRWLEIARNVVTPFATKISKSYITDVGAVAICTLYYSMPERYRRRLMSTNSRGCSCEVRQMLADRQAVEFVKQTRRKVVGKLMESAIGNVLKRMKDDARCQRLRLKKQRRRLKSMSLDDSTENPATEQVDSLENATPSILALEGVDSSSSSRGTDECLVCFDSLGSKRLLFTCGHARCCLVCAPILPECPMCQQPVSILMEIFV